MIISFISWIVFGLLVGAIARFVYPGRQGLGLTQTTLLGVAGSFVGGFIGWLVFGGSPLQASGWIGSVIGSVIVLAILIRQQRITSQPTA